MAAARAERPFDAARFEQSLRDVAAWVEVQGIRDWRSGSLRDPRLRPEPPLPVRDQSWATIVSTACTCVDDLAAKRRALLGSQQRRLDLRGARILVCEWQQSMWDTLPGHVTQGFFDDDDLPPWDHWVDLVVDAEATRTLIEENGNSPTPFWGLLAYVPRQLVDLADGGPLVSCTPCVYWLRHSRWSLTPRRHLHPLSPVRAAFASMV
jgi:hypothetical protein